MTITVSGSTITFNDSTTQSTSAIPSSLSGVGSVLMVAQTGASNLLPGATVAGSSLYYPSTLASTPSNFNIYTEWNGGAMPYTQLAGDGGYSFNTSQRLVTGNGGFSAPGGHTALSGTWRVLTAVRARVSSYDGIYNYTTSYSTWVMAQRIS